MEIEINSDLSHNFRGLKTKFKEHLVEYEMLHSRKEWYNLYLYSNKDNNLKKYQETTFKNIFYRHTTKQNGRWIQNIDNFAIGADYKINGQKLSIDIDTDFFKFKKTLSLKKSFKWGWDKYGITVMYKGIDYHPNFLDKNWKSEAYQILVKKSKEKQVKTKNKNAFLKFLEKQKDYIITVEDSLKAGNCRVGTLAFCDRNKLGKDAQVKKLLKLLNKDSRIMKVLEYVFSPKVLA